MWFTETPWPTMMIFGLAALVMLLNWSRSGNSKPLFVGVLCLAATVGVYFLEQAIVTESERVEQLVFELSDAVISGNADKTLSYISSEWPDIKQTVTGAMKMVTIDDDLSITDIKTEMLPEESLAKIHFRANGTVRVPTANYSSHTPSRWELTWKRESGDWKIVKITRLNVINGDEIGLLSK